MEKNISPAKIYGLVKEFFKPINDYRGSLGFFANPQKMVALAHGSDFIAFLPLDYFCRIFSFGAVYLYNFLIGAHRALFCCKSK
ncbi:MAG: hypothetical protein A3I88_02320 [Candidatus Portnoybacteria bacterium RIFCSPLOWO2_12_FULL_39_9]|uniref:Uncharacterized protein n=1 Tax=Candidatus Portnoybacteria bacterium RIFCSPHIGHO2_12_FULL_38_9 TaxID=1801997 RepID=A0A1G2FGJ7_9BACT|nr:MAG: hypothetical protein A3J64_03245 [Candidatus Portnoybacteria bacterium RIFCSPHIGHO2_12_FULL_38_9]OGZ38926.1 MAG: hypothetical protein A3F21_03665 [Candidatus Portnoybacteria bacterium RIFCSPLOWO2_01_FULL_38_39]OGZ40427.1 MAG: hypothetical protein A3I88_02320 [Candidatus Portnoybacteria bacterium RIFCSPLOWO2_12_FULL_39_9]